MPDSQDRGFDLVARFSWRYVVGLVSRQSAIDACLPACRSSHRKHEYHRWLPRLPDCPRSGRSLLASLHRRQSRSGYFLSTFGWRRDTFYSALVRRRELPVPGNGGTCSSITSAGIKRHRPQLLGDYDGDNDVDLELTTPFGEANSARTIRLPMAIETVSSTRPTMLFGESTITFSHCRVREQAALRRQCRNRAASC